MEFLLLRGWQFIYYRGGRKGSLRGAPPGEPIRSMGGSPSDRQPVIRVQNLWAHACATLFAANKKLRKKKKRCTRSYTGRVVGFCLPEDTGACALLLMHEDFAGMLEDHSVRTLLLSSVCHSWPQRLAPVPPGRRAEAHDHLLHVPTPPPWPPHPRCPCLSPCPDLFQVSSR